MLQSVLCRSEYVCLHKTVNMVVFFTKKIMKIPTQKGEHLYKCTEFSLKRKEGIVCVRRMKAEKHKQLFQSI